MARGEPRASEHRARSPGTPLSQLVLADTSAWVEFDRRTETPADVRVAELIGGDGALAWTEPVLMEVMAGACDDARERDLRRAVTRNTLVPFDAAGDFEAAARIYRRCRKVGVTPRGPLDTAIAAVARRSGSAVLSWDVDLARICSVMSIDTDPASLPA